MKKIILILFLMACSNSGGHWQHYRISALDEARERDMAIILHVYAEADEISQKQKKILEKIIKDSRFKAVGAYRVQFGVEKEIDVGFQVRKPGTVLVFQGKSELGRSTSLDESDLQKLLLKVAKN